MEIFKNNDRFRLELFIRPGPSLDKYFHKENRHSTACEQPPAGKSSIVAVYKKRLSTLYPELSSSVTVRVPSGHSEAVICTIPCHYILTDLDMRFVFESA